MDYSFKTGLLGEMSHTSWKHICLPPPPPPAGCEMYTHAQQLVFNMCRRDESLWLFHPMGNNADERIVLTLSRKYVRPLSQLDRCTPRTKNTLPPHTHTKGETHTMPTHPCSVIIFCLYPLATHSYTNTLLNLFFPEKIGEDVIFSVG